MKHLLVSLIGAALLGACTPNVVTEDIPLPEHPRPDFERPDWVNLNGNWRFTFDAQQGQVAEQDGNSLAFNDTIQVPFPWGSALSGVEDQGDVAWYGRTITVPSSWKDKRVFLIVGASDWETTAWCGTHQLGTHQGGYTPFEFELTDDITFGAEQQILLKVDDTSSDAHLYGKQGYGNARGIWQTVYLEARGKNYIKSIHFTPDIDQSLVHVSATFDAAGDSGENLVIQFKDGSQEMQTVSVSGQQELAFDIPLKDQHLWDLDDPYLYEIQAQLTSGSQTLDEVNTYFGQRKISAVNFPGAEYKYVALNNKPVYLQLCLDQSYNPDGFYTFPSDEFMKNEILLSKKLGLNGNRIHIKVEVPRKLYWADKLGLLIMADTPNFWGAPVEEARTDWERCLRAQVERDYNHPSIFAWVNFNETWGLFTDGKYLPETQQWVKDMYHLTKSLDATRFVEDNSACNYDHVETDLNTWHSYQPGWNWEEFISNFDKQTFPGSTYNYAQGYQQNDVPMLNSECGNVWGYEGSAGDCDFTWDYHIMINNFRQHPKVAGWLYTEHHDVINEWNGYVKYDRTPKIDGLDELVPGMTMADFQSLYYLAPQIYLYTEQHAGATVQVPLYASFMTDKNPGALTLETQLVGWNTLGEPKEFEKNTQSLDFQPYLSQHVRDISVTMPAENGLYLLRLVLKNADGQELHHNFTTFRVRDGKDAVVEKSVITTFAPNSYTASEWSYKKTEVLGGKKVDGFGNGYLEYTVALPQGLKKENVTSVTLLFEAGSKTLFGKDKDDDQKIEGDYMRGKGTFDPCKSPNSYGMTDGVLHASQVQVTVNGKDAGTYDLTDDPADHRGILSWAAQPKERKLYEAGSYGQLIRAEIPLSALEEGQPLTIRFTVPSTVSEGNGGLALYGKDFGRYPLDPTLIFGL